MAITTNQPAMPEINAEFAASYNARPIQDFPDFGTFDEYRAYIAGISIPLNYVFDKNARRDLFLHGNQTIGDLKAAFQKVNLHRVLIGPCVDPEPDSFCGLYRHIPPPLAPDQEFA